MEERVLRSLATKSISLMLGVLIISIIVTRFNGLAFLANITAQNESVYDDSILMNEEEIQPKVAEKVVTSKLKKNSLGENYLKIKRSGKKDSVIALDDLYMDRAITLTVENLQQKSYTDKSIKSKLKDTVKGVEVSYIHNSKNRSYTAFIQIILNNLYVHEVFEDSDYIYINLKNPHDVYDKIIVIDSGHGGNDVGAYSKDMKYYEKNLNLGVVLYLKEMLDKEKIKVYYTRLTDEKVYLSSRYELANTLKADFFISVHCNADDNKKANGTEVLFDEKAETKGFCSKKLAKICLDEMLSAIKRNNRGLLESNKICIIGNSKVPVALIEVGFMSNDKEMEFLGKKENLKKAALGVYNSIMKAYEALEDEEK